MDIQELKFIRAALPAGRTLFYDFPGRHALFILEQVLGGDRVSVAELKKSRYAALLNHPQVKAVLAEVGRPWLTVDDLQLGWPGRVDTFRLSLGTWPRISARPNRRWDQITRWGWNLVLQLNVVSTHKRSLEKSVPDWEDHTPSWHPVAGGGELTLAWARLDIDLEGGEALIEEIQSDWVRDVRDYASHRYYSDWQHWKAYRDATLRPLEKRWSESMLTSALWFLTEELGIERVFYHTHHSGAQLKRIGGNQPPRSLYTDLPRKYCFRVTHNGPGFLRDTKDKRLKRLFVEPATQWFVQDFAL